MGYRPEIVSEIATYYGTKLYGYYEATNLLSLKYLRDIGVIQENTQWDYGYPNDITLIAQQFYIWIHLYRVDYLSCRNQDIFDMDHGILRLIAYSMGPKHVSWGVIL